MTTFDFTNPIEKHLSKMLKLEIDDEEIKNPRLKKFDLSQHERLIMKKNSFKKKKEFLKQGLINCNLKE